MARRKDRQDVRMTNTTCGADCWTDHRLVSKFNLRTTTTRQKVSYRLNVSKLKQYSNRQSIYQWYLLPFRCTGTQFIGCSWELDSLQRHPLLFSNGFPKTIISQTPRLVWWEWRRKPGILEEKHKKKKKKKKKNIRHTAVIPAQYLVRLPIQTYVRQSRLCSETCKTPGWAKRLMILSLLQTERICSLMYLRQYMVPRAQEPPHSLVQMELVFWLTKKLSWKDEAINNNR